MKLISFLILLLGCATPPKNKLSKDINLEFETIINKDFDDQFSGAVLIKSPKCSFVRSYGFANKETKELNSSSTITLIASNTKIFTAAAILKLEELGKLSVGDEMSKYFPELNAAHLAKNGIKVQIHHLLNHTSGLPSDYDEFEPIKSMIFKEKFGFPQVVAAIKEVPLTSEPGKEFKYSNTGYVLLGEIVRRVSKTSFAHFAKEKLFDPARMKNTTVGIPDHKAVARPYRLKDSKIEDIIDADKIIERHDEDLFTDGNIYSTLEDLDLWVRALSEERIVGPRSLKKMMTPGPKGYGYGVVTNDKKGEREFSHGGYWLGYESYYDYHPDLKLSIVYYFNLQFKHDYDFHEHLKAKALEVCL